MVHLPVGLVILGACHRSPPVPAVEAPPSPPVAQTVAHAVSSPFGTRDDPYYWLRDDTRQDPAVLGFLNAQNAYTDAVLAPTAGLRQVLYDEIVARIPPDDSSVPTEDDGWWRWVRFERGREYPVFLRRQWDGPEQIVVDGNTRAEGQPFYEVGELAYPTDATIVAWTEDTVGRRQFTVQIRDLQTGEVLPDTIPNVEKDIAWADGRTLLYIEKDPVTLLGSTVRKHVVGTDPANDPVVYQEADPSFYLDVWRSRSDRFLHIGLEGTTATEQWVADTADPAFGFRVLIPREPGHLYEAEDHGDRWILKTNREAVNFRVVEAPMATVADRGTWTDRVPHRSAALVEGFQTFDTFLAVEERSDGLRKVRIHPWSGEERVVEVPDPTSTTVLGENPETDRTAVRIAWTSLTTPLTVTDHDVATGVDTVLKRDEVVGAFEPSQYRSEVLRATARDGTAIPVSVVYRDGMPKGGPLLVYGYGSYGSSEDPTFSAARLSLLDRGFVYAIAHVRGGQELGRGWYDDGHLLRKQNSFTDFVDVTRFLVAEGYGDPDRVAAMGLSAGGLLMGAVVNLAPDEYRAVIADVPFVDVVTTMLDPTIPLTTNEYEEWGNPAVDAETYAYLLAYSPYDNVAARPYPAMLVSAGLWDSQVQYYEPAKWVAKLQAVTTGERPILLHTNMDAGHGGKSGRFRQYEDTARQFAFLIDQLDVTP